MADEVRKTVPHDRLTRISDAMSKTMDLHPEKLPGDRAVIFLDSRDENRGGICIHDYDDDIEAVVDLFVHLRAIMRANGKDMEIITVPNDASGLT